MSSPSDVRVPAPPPAGPARLHPAAVVLWPLRQVGPLALVLLIGGLPLLLAGVLGYSVVTSLVRYARFRWWVDGEAFVIDQGLIRRQRRVIPLQRIQSVEIVRGIRHRLLGVVELRAEAIGGSSTEGRLDALAPEDAQRLRDILLSRRAEAAAATDAPEVPLVSLAPAELVLAGVTGGRVGVVAAILGFLQEVAGDRVARMLERLPGVLGAEGILALVLLILVLAFVLAVAATALAYWDFTLWRDGDHLRIRRGLLDQRLETIPLARIQALRVEENAVRRLLGLAAVKADLAGRAGQDRGRETGLLLPLGRRAGAFALVAEILGDGDLADAALAPMPRGALHRRYVRAGVVTVMLTAVAAGFAGWSGLLALLAAMPAAAAARGAYQALGWGRHSGVVVTRSGLAVRRTAFVPVRRVQSLALVASPFQRRRGLATLEFQIARSAGVWRGPQAIDIRRDEGLDRLRELGTELSTPPLVR